MRGSKETKRGLGAQKEKTHDQVCRNEREDKLLRDMKQRTKRMRRGLSELMLRNRRQRTKHAQRGLRAQDMRKECVKKINNTRYMKRTCIKDQKHKAHGKNMQRKSKAPRVHEED